MTPSRTIATLIGAACLAAWAPDPEPPPPPAPVAAAAELTIAGVGFGPAEITDAKVGFAPGGEPVIQIKFTPEGRSRFSGLTADHIGQTLPLVLDGNLLSAPLVSEAIDSQTIQISGSFTVEEAMALARRIAGGQP